MRVRRAYEVVLTVLMIMVLQMSVSMTMTMRLMVFFDVFLRMRVCSIRCGIRTEGDR